MPISERMPKTVPKDASLSAFVRFKSLAQGWGQGMTDAHSRKKASWNPQGRESSLTCLEQRCLERRLAEGDAKVGRWSPTALCQFKSVSPGPINN